MTRAERADVVSSFTLIKGAMIEETWTAFQHWDLERTVNENLEALCHENPFGATTNWLRDVYKVLHRRVDPERDRPLIFLAKAGFDREAWKPLLLWHMTRDEFLLREFLTTWLWERFDEGALHVETAEAMEWLKQVEAQKQLSWADRTRREVAGSLFGITSDMGLTEGTKRRRFRPYHLPEPSFLYLLHAMAESEPNARRLVHLPDWRMYRMRPEDVEHELMRLHQYRRLHYDVAGSLAQLKLPAPSLAAWVSEVTA